MKETANKETEKPYNTNTFPSNSHNSLALVEIRRKQVNDHLGKLDMTSTHFNYDFKHFLSMTKSLIYPKPYSIAQSYSIALQYISQWQVNPIYKSSTYYTFARCLILTSKAPLYIDQII